MVPFYYIAIYVLNTHMLHGAGIFTYIYPKNHPVM